MLNADKYLPTDNTAIPYGDPEPVKDTPMDFTTPVEIGKRINDDFEQLRFGKGYDHTFVLNKNSSEEFSLQVIANLPRPVSEWIYILRNRDFSYILLTGLQETSLARMVIITLRDHLSVLKRNIFPTA